MQTLLIALKVAADAAYVAAVPNAPYPVIMSLASCVRNVDDALRQTGVEWRERVALPPDIDLAADRMYAIFGRDQAEGRDGRLFELAGVSGPLVLYRRKDDPSRVFGITPEGRLCRYAGGVGIEVPSEAELVREMLA